jgi:uncharacterized membrane protein
MNSLLTPVELACIAIAVAAVLTNFVMVAMRWSDLPEKVPRHYGLTGRPDHWSPKGVIWIYPGISLVMMVAMAGSLMAGADKLDSEALRAQFALNLRPMSIMAAYLSVLMLALTMRTVAVAEKRAAGLGRLFIPAILASVAIIVVLFRK